MSWQEILKDPEYNAQIQKIVRSRVKDQGQSRAILQTLSPALRQLAETHGLDPQKTAMVGDREIDLASGRSAGVWGIHYLCKTVPQTLQCHWRFSDYAQMAKLLKDKE